MTVQVGKPAPDFKLMGLVNGKYKEVHLAQFKGRKKVVVFFYPGDFTFVCPTEILAFSDSLEQFRKRDTVVLGISTDSIYSHLAWSHQDRRQGGVKGISFPLLSDFKKETAAEYGVLMEETGQAFRGLFIINQKGILKQITINHHDLGRNVEEVLRILDAIDHCEKYGQVCPANWKPGEKALDPSPEGLEAYTKDCPEI